MYKGTSSLRGKEPEQWKHYILFLPPRITTHSNSTPQTLHSAHDTRGLSNAKEMASTNKRRRSRKRAGSDSSCSPPPSMTTPPETGDISTPRSLRVRERLTSPQRELALRLEASTRRGIPCIPCMEAQSEWTPEIGKPILCLEGEREFLFVGILSAVGTVKSGVRY